MWTHEIGRHQAANLPLLRTVFEVHLRLIAGGGTSADVVKPKKSVKPLLLFILRDWDESTPADSLSLPALPPSLPPSLQPALPPACHFWGGGRGTALVRLGVCLAGYGSN